MHYAFVAGISRSDSFAVQLGRDAVRDIVLAWYEHLPHTVVTDDAGTIEIKSGSQVKLRLLGGAFIAPSSLPLRTTVTMVSDGATTHGTITATDAVGFGIKTGMRGKYERRVTEVVESLCRAVGSGT